MSVAHGLVLGPVVVVAATLQGIAGFGFALSAMPAALLVLPPHLAVSSVALLGSVSLALGAVRDRGCLSRRNLPVMAVGATVGVLAGLPILLVAQAAYIKLIAGLSSLVAVGAMLSSPGAPFRNERVALGTAGLLSGVLQGTSGQAGPPMVLVVTKQAWDAGRMRGTLAAYFLFINALLLTALGIEGRVPRATWVVSAVLAPLVVLGVLAGRAVAGRISAPRARLLNLAIVTASGTLAIVAALHELARAAG